MDQKDLLNNLIEDKTIQKQMLKDKINFIKSNEAYVSFINSLIEHKKDLSDLNLKELA